MRYSYHLSQMEFYEKGPTIMQERELTLFGGWAKARILGPIEIGVVKPSDTTTTSSSSLDELPSVLTDFKLAKLMAKYPTDVIPLCHRSLFREYLKKVAHHPLDTMAWVVIDCGHESYQLKRDVLAGLASKFLRSEDTTKVKMAVEAMSRTLGIWEANNLELFQTEQEPAVPVYYVPCVVCRKPKNVKRADGAYTCGTDHSKDY